MKEWLTKWNPKHPKRIVVSLREKKLYLFHRRSLLTVFLVSTGRNDYTPRGIFRIYYKTAMVRYSDGNGLFFWLEFKPKYGIHGLPFDQNGVEFGAEDIGKPTSAGCIRLHTVDASLLFYFVPTDSVLIIQDNPPTF